MFSAVPPAVTRSCGAQNLIGPCTPAGFEGTFTKRIDGVACVRLWEEAIRKIGGEEGETMASRVTAELFTVPVEGGHLVYAPLRQAAFLANARTVNLIADLAEGRAASAEHAELAEFLRRLQIVDAGEERRPIVAYAGDPKPVEVTLFLTTACNLRCRYCYASAGDTPTKIMPLEVARRGIDYVITNALELGEPAIDVNYHGGGEPTVNWKTLTGSYVYAREKTRAAGLDLRGSLATNGVMPADKLDWVIQNLQGVSLSFDGIPAVHDAHRIHISGAGSSGDVIRTIERFDGADFPYGLRLTVTREHIASLEASIEFICSRFRPRHIQVEPSYQLGRWREAPSAETAEFIAAYRAAQKAARRHGREIEFSGARLGLLSNHFCGVTQDSFCLTADGNVSACYETFLEQNEWSKVFFYGSYAESEKGYRFDLKILDALRHQSVENRKFCESCFAKWSCGGDCYHKSLAVNGEGEFKGTDRCHIIRELTKDQILERIGGAGGVFWHEPPSERPAEARGKEFLS